MRPAFFLRAYNDLDHLSPLIWKCIKKGDNPLIIFTTKIDYNKDYRIQFLLSEGNATIKHFLDADYCKQDSRSLFFKKIYNLKRNPDRFFGRLYRYLFFKCDNEISFLKNNNISVCIFEWSTPYSRGIIHERFFKASKAIGATTFCLPHGCNIYTGSDVTEGYVKSLSRGNIPDQSRRNEYDYYIFQNTIRIDGWVKWGYDPNKTLAWGSTRFCFEWHKINLKISPSVVINKKTNNMFKVVFMDHQKDYNVNVSKIWSLLNRIAEDKEVLLVIKKSTRSGKDYHSKSFIEKYNNSPNVEFVGNENHSPKLIEWSDCVINFGSSIGVEVLLQNKPLVNPFYLHSNETLFEKFDAALNASDEDSVINYLNNLKIGKELTIPKENIDKLFSEIIFGGKREHDILEKYYKYLTLDNLIY